MIGTLLGRARPTAVNTESSENTMSITAICTTIAKKVEQQPHLVGRFIA